METARQAVGASLGVPSENILLVQNTTQALQMILQSFLLEPGDELVTTTHEHGCMRVVSRYLQETRGSVIKAHSSEPLNGSAAFTQGILDLVTKRTRIVALSEIDCYSGWRPNLSELRHELEKREIPFLLDGAHAAGQGPTAANGYGMWIGSGHKWLGGPNGTGFLYVPDRFKQHLRPMWLGDRYYNEFSNDLRRFEFPGTNDVVRWWGLAVACELQQKLGDVNISLLQGRLRDHLVQQLARIKSVQIRTPLTVGEGSGMLAFTWSAEDLRVPHLKEFLWSEHRIWTQPDFCYGEEGHGLRISCHTSTRVSEVDRLCEVLESVVKP